MLPKFCGGNSSSRINNDWGIIDNPGKRDLILLETGKSLPSTFQNGMSNSTQGIVGTKKRHNPLTLKIQLLKKFFAIITGFRNASYRKAIKKGTVLRLLFT
jgi:hypothetical protein